MQGIVEFTAIEVEAINLALQAREDGRYDDLEGLDVRMHTSLTRRGMWRLRAFLSDTESEVYWAMRGRPGLDHLRPLYANDIVPMALRSAAWTIAITERKVFGSLGTPVTED